MRKFLTLATVVLALLLSVGAGMTATAYAAQDDSQDSNNDNVSHAMSESVYRRLKAAQDDLKDKKYSDALAKLNDLIDVVKDNPYELAVTYQTVAFVYIDQEKYKQALPYLKKALDLNALPKQQQHQETLTLAQLYASQEEYQNSINLLENWFRKEKNPPTSAYVLAATAYYQLHKLQPAVKYIKQAIAKDKQPHETWYNLYLGIEFEMKNYDTAADVLKKMISLWPNKPKYWRNLAGIYLQQNKDKDALAVMKIAYQKDYLDDEGQLLNLARLEIVHGMPYYAGQLIEKGMKNGKIKSNQDNMQLLVTAWTAAQETDKALKALDQAASMAKDGELYLQKAQLCYQQAEWDCTAEAAQKAVTKGGLKHPGKAYIMEGMALAQSKKYDAATKVFHQAQHYDDTRKQATDWIKYMKNTLAATG